MRSINEGLVDSPTFTPHRVKVVANDPAPPSSDIKLSHGMDSADWAEVVAQVQLNTATTAATIEALYWSERDAAFVKAEPAETFALTASRAIRIKTAGRRFFLHVSALAGVTKQVDIDVAGAASSHKDFA